LTKPAGFRVRDLLVALVAFGLIPFTIIKPHVGILVWSWLSYMNPHQLAWGFARGFPFAQVIAVVTLLAWFISREPKRLPLHPVTFWLVAFTAWISFTSLFIDYPDYGYAKWERTIKILAVNAFLTICLMNSRERLQALIWVIVLSVGFFGVKGGISTLLGGGRHLVYGPGGMIGSNGSIGLSLLMVIPLMLYLRSTITVWAAKAALSGAIALSLVAVLGTWSRGALVGLLAMILMLFLKMRNRFVIAVLVTLVISVGLHFMPQPWQERMGTILNYDWGDDGRLTHEDASAQGRIDAWRYGIEVATSSPIVGGGFEIYRGYVTESRGGWRSPHSIIFEVLAEHGFVGLALYFALALTTWRTAASIMSLTRKENSELRWAHDLAAMTQVSLVAYFACGLFLNQAYLDLYFHLTVIVALTHVLVRKRDVEATILQREHAIKPYVRAGDTPGAPGSWGRASGGARVPRH
jgi:probable O-glycosylation ligase (exosortase A-associated)